jgi:chemotaxis protein histidine kinase CheA
VAKEFLRRIDRWRFEAPLALVLGCAAGFAASAMPDRQLSDIPLIGHLGFIGRAAIALCLGILCGMSGYAVMRAPVAAKPEPEPEVEDVDFSDEDMTAATPAQRAERMRRARKADAHPDAPLRAPIRASRDLGEPFMEVNAFPQPEGEEPVAESEPAPSEAEAVAVQPETTEVEAVAAEEAHIAEEEIDVWAVQDEAEPADTVEAVAAPDQTAPESGPQPEPAPPARREGVVRADRQSLNEMIDRLSAGLERRARRNGASGATPAQSQRDMRPAMREALEELNRLAAARQR